MTCGGSISASGRSSRRAHWRGLASPRTAFGSTSAKPASEPRPHSSLAAYPDPSALVGRLVVAVVNLGARRVAGYKSEVLVLGALGDGGAVPILCVDPEARPGWRVG